jgi:hypothetical protein
MDDDTLRQIALKKKQIYALKIIVVLEVVLFIIGSLLILSGKI